MPKRRKEFWRVDRLSARVRSFRMYVSGGFSVAVSEMKRVRISPRGAAAREEQFNERRKLASSTKVDLSSPRHNDRVFTFLVPPRARARAALIQLRGHVNTEHVTRRLRAATRMRYARLTSPGYGFTPYRGRVLSFTLIV